MPVVSVQARRGGSPVYPAGLGTQVVSGTLTIDVTAIIGLDANVYTGPGTYTVFTATSIVVTPTGSTLSASNFVPPAGLYVKTVTVNATSILVELATV